MPNLSIGDVVVLEGSGTGVTQMTFLLTLSAPSASEVRVQWSTQAGIATSPTDYVAVNAQTATIAAGASMSMITVDVNRDDDFEQDETFNVVLQQATNATLARATALGTILNDDAEPTFGVDDPVAVEIDGGLSMLFTVTLSRPVTSATSVSFATTDAGTATPGVDFEHVTGSLAFPAGTTTMTVPVTVRDDVNDENSETIELLLSQPMGASLSDATGLGVIVDEDPLPELRPELPLVAPVNEDAGTVLFRVGLSPPSQKQVSARWFIAAFNNGPAMAGADYQPDGGLLTFAPGVTSLDVPVQIVNDTVSEPDELITLSLDTSSLMNAQSTVSVTNPLTIRDDDAPVISVANITVNEPDPSGGGVDAVVTFTLSSPAPFLFSLFYSTDSSAGCSPCATAATDYTAVSTTLVQFMPGQQTATAIVRIQPDLLDEADENIRVIFQSATTSQSGLSLITIIDNDPTPTLTITPTTFAEGNGNVNRNQAFTATLSAVSGRTITFTVAAVAGTAIAWTGNSGDFYPITSGNLTINPGTATRTFNVQIVADNAGAATGGIEPNETFHLDLSNLVNVSGPARTTVTITNDD